MSFLDSLENNLKALEGNQLTDFDDRKRKETERRRTAAVAPWAEKLKASPYTQELMQQATRAGYQMRTKVNFVWIGITLRLEARNHRLEFQPSPDGITVVTFKDSNELKRETIDLTGKPENVLGGWIEILERQKKEDEQAAAAYVPVE
jgi:hypothetical protein